jgi:hypothetical protein
LAATAFQATALWKAAQEKAAKECFPEIPEAGEKGGCDGLIRRRWFSQGEELFFPRLWTDTFWPGSGLVAPLLAGAEHKKAAAGGRRRQGWIGGAGVKEALVWLLRPLR